MRRLTRARAATDDEATPQATAASQPVGEPDDAQQGASGLPANGTPPSEEPTVVLPGGKTATAPTEPADVARDLPAGVDPGVLGTAPTSARRGRLRRRLRYLRHVRELLLRDLGGFYYEASRSDEGAEGHRGILDAKAARISKLDTEVRDLEGRLSEPRAETVLREPGIGGTCPACGELHSSEARFCSRCGNPLTGRAAREHAARVAPVAASEEPKATTASLWGRPNRPQGASPSDATQPSGELRPPTPPPAQRGGEESAEAPADAVGSDEAAAKSADAEDGDARQREAEVAEARSSSGGDT